MLTATLGLAPRSEATSTSSLSVFSNKISAFTPTVTPTPKPPTTGGGGGLIPLEPRTSTPPTPTPQPTPEPVQQDLTTFNPERDAAAANGEPTVTQESAIGPMPVARPNVPYLALAGLGVAALLGVMWMKKSKNA